MNLSADSGNLKAGDQIGGYFVKQVVRLRDIRAIFYELEHAASGAKHIHLANQDAENTFGVSFKTVPTDSTGVAHILEHTVLCGSEKFPVRDPFFSMIKRSLNTFMNAFTASDWTMYPFCTQNRKDYYNLMNVYLDAAFFPKLEKLNFKQEGHRLEIEGERLVYKGVVYNEMKGAMSSPNQVMGRSLLNALYPDTTYGHNSGGDPAAIPTLTYEQLKQFHARHYHPSNAWFYTYGNLPLKDTLLFIEDRVLKKFSRIDPKTDVPCQPRWTSPKTVTYHYPLAKNEDAAKKSQVCVAWLLSDITDTYEVLGLTLLSQILLGNSASPLRKALIESELGSALSDSTGFDGDNRDTLFACGLKDVSESSAPQIEKIVFDVLTDLAAKGIDQELIDSAIHQMEFHRKEVTNSPYPYGLKLLFFLSGTWFHGGDPIKIFEFDDYFKHLREELAKGAFFESRIKRYFLDNPHRVLFRLIPDQQMEEKENTRIAEELDRVKAGLSPNDLEKIRQDAESLTKLQEGAENLSCLPTLELEDIPPLSLSIKESRTSRDPNILSYEQPTSGIFYFTAVSGIGKLPKHLIPLVPFFCQSFSRVGTARHDYTEMARKIDLYTGGVGLSPHARTPFDAKGECLPFVSFNGKCLNRNQEKLFEIIDELICEPAFSDLSRLKNLFMEYRAGLESAIVQNGHGLAMSLASRNFSITRALNETWSGVHQLQTIKAIGDKLNDDKLRALSEDLKTIAGIIFKSDNLNMAIIGEDQALSEAVSMTTAFTQKLGQGMPDGFVPPPIEIGNDLIREGWSTSSAVSFVASAFMTVRMAHEDAPALSVISKMLRSLYIHREVREKGGAYGGFASYSSEDGAFSFGSYRDPHVISTLKAYDGACAFIKSGDYTDEDVKEAILQVCAEIDKPDTPADAAKKSFYRKLISLTDEARNRFKQGLLTLNRSKIKAVAENYFDEHAQKSVAVISGEDKLKESNEKMKDNPLKLFMI